LQCILICKYEIEEMNLASYLDFKIDLPLPQYSFRSEKEHIAPRNWSNSLHSKE
jgi:hypothetical protein